MPDYELVALLILSILGPVVLGLILLAVVTHTKRAVVLAYACGMLVLLAAVSASVGFNMYVATIAAFVTVVLGFIATVELLPELASD
jgi:uncharacterized membrane protein